MLKFVYGSFNTVGDCLCDRIKILIKKHIVAGSIDIADFKKDRRHVCAREHSEIFAFRDSEIGKTDIFQFAVNVPCQKSGGAGIGVYQSFYTGVGVGNRGGIAMNRNKQVGCGPVSLSSFLGRRLVDVAFSRVQNI